MSAYRGTSVSINPTYSSQSLHRPFASSSRPGALLVIGAVGVQPAWVIAVGEQTAVAIRGAALVTSAIKLVCVTVQQQTVCY